MLLDTNVLKYKIKKAKKLDLQESLFKPNKAPEEIFFYLIPIICCKNLWKCFVIIIKITSAWRLEVTKKMLEKCLKSAWIKLLHSLERSTKLVKKLCNWKCNEITVQEKKTTRNFNQGVQKFLESTKPKVNHAFFLDIVP